QMQLVADESARRAVARGRHRRQHDPPVGYRLIGLERAERIIRTFVLPFTSGYIDPPVVRAPAAAAAWCRHPRLDRAPEIARRIVFLDDVGVARGGDVGGAKAPADHANLS